MEREKKALAREPATKKEKIQCKVAPVFAIYSALKQTRPWSSFHDGNIGHSSHDLIPAASFLLRFFPFCRQNC